MANKQDKLTTQERFLIHYTAPKEAPPPRHPPTRDSGLIGWMRSNLFGNRVDTISTLITLAFVLFFANMFLDWAIFQAQWEIVFLNLRPLGAGPEYPPSEVARLEIVMYMLFFLALLSVGYWGRIRTTIFVVLAFIALATVIVPILTRPVEEPPIYYYVDGDYKIRQVNFIADKGQQITFSLDPLTEKSDFNVTHLQGYIGNEKLPGPAWDAFNETAGLVNRDQLDPTAYDLNLAIQIWDRHGQVIEQSEFTTDTVSFEWEAPAEDWYTVTVIRNEENSGTQGAAFLKIEDLAVFYSTRTEIRKRLDRFGEPPQLDCEGCAIATNRTDLRYNGERTLAQFFSLQLAPYFTEIRMFYFISLAVGLVGYGLGQIAKNQMPDKTATRLILGAWLVSLPIYLVIVTGINNSTTLPPIDTRDLGGIFLTVLLSAVAIVASFPIGIVLALGRQSDLPLVSFLCTLFIEVVRGVPLITLLFMGYLILPFVVDGMETVDLVIRLAIVLTLFTAAYLAETIRGGLQIIPKGQTEAARALGLSELYITGFIVLPQAIRAVIPAIMGQFVSLLKDTSLITLVGVFELTGAMRRLLADTQTGYTLFQREGYLYIGIVYFILCYVLAEVSRHLETTGSGAARR